MKRPYQIVNNRPSGSQISSRELADFLSKDGHLLLPLVELLERGERAIDEVIDVMGRATVEAVLRMSAEQVAGPKLQGRRVGHHRPQQGLVPSRGRDACHPTMDIVHRAG